ncbi:succinate--CoA ligase subunit alpha [bacterium]|nr:succinate--CoA ligase subunit alpha [bacterium]
MSILIDKNSRVVVQGITGGEGTFHTRLMMEYGTNVVAGVTPGKGGQKFDDKVPIFNTVLEAADSEGADTSIIFVPPAFAQDAIVEAIDVDMGVICCITEGIAVNDMIKVYNYLAMSDTVLVGPNSPGIISVDECKLGIMPGQIFKKGPVGLASRSGTLTYEIVDQLTRAGIGQSTCLGVGGDPIIGLSFIDLLDDFEGDPETEVILLVGEIGGSDEEIAAEHIASEISKPVVAFVSGRTAPKGKRMGHAGAIVSGNKGTAESKVKAFDEAGVPVPISIEELVEEIGKALKK